MSSYDPLFDESGVWYPRGTATVIFKDGIIWGGYIHDGNIRPLRVGGQTYLIGTTPGRIISLGNPQNPNDPDVRIYRIRPDWQTVSDDELRLDASELLGIPPSQVTQGDINAVRAQYGTDWNEWPAQYGAPYYDLNGNGQWDPGVDEPGLANADQVIWFTVNDLDPGATVSLYGSFPIGLELQVTMWGYKSSGPQGQTAYRRYRIINKSGFTVDSMFVAQWSDPDVGNYTDDFVGCDTVLSLGYGYNGYPTDFNFQAFGLPPAAIGYSLLQGPIIPSPGDTAFFDFKKRPNYKNLPMTSFSYFSAGGFPWTDPILGDYQGTLVWYKMLNGYAPNNPDTTDLIYYTIGSGPNIGKPTKFPLSGDPVLGIGDLDGQGINYPPGDRRMALCSGPFTLQHGDTQEIVVTITGGIDPNGDHLASVFELKNNVQYLFANYGLLEPIPVIEHEIRYPNPSSTEILLQTNLQSFSNVTSAEVSFSPQIGSEPGFIVTLFDDGLHQDSLAGDNIWGNSIMVNNRKYPFKAGLKVIQTTGQKNFQNLLTSLLLRNKPSLTNWLVVWENGQQDLKINWNEKVHLHFDIQNNDNLNNINNVKISNLNHPFSNQIVNHTKIISPGASGSSDSLFLVLLGPSYGDSITFTYRIIFDYHSMIDTATYPVYPWNPSSIWGDTLEVTSIVGFTGNVYPIIADPLLITGHIYEISFFENPDTTIEELLWRLTDKTTGVLKLDNGKVINDPLYPHPIIDGVLYTILPAIPDFTDFQTVANASGPLDPPEGASAEWQGFPGIGRPTNRQQVGDGRWLFQQLSDPNNGSYDFFRQRVSQYSGGFLEPITGMDFIVPDDYEIRFTQSGGRALFRWPYFFNGHQYVFMADVPFELWNIGDVENPNDDFQCLPWIFDADTNGVFNLINEDHAVSSDANDPYTDGIYWVEPLSRKQSGFDSLLALHEAYPSQASEAVLWVYKTTNYGGIDWNSIPGLMRMVFVN
ncbi:MAG: hypothetical protein Kow0042_09980 [Calditrichia bacterium]